MTLASSPHMYAANATPMHRSPEIFLTTYNFFFLLGMQCKFHGTWIGGCLRACLGACENFHKFLKFFLWRNAAFIFCLQHIMLYGNSSYGICCMFATCFNIISGEVFRAVSLFCPLAHLDKQMEDEVEEKKRHAFSVCTPCDKLLGGKKTSHLACMAGCLVRCLLFDR